MEVYISVHGLEEAICTDVTISKADLELHAMPIDFFLKNLTAVFIIYMEKQMAKSSWLLENNVKRGEFVSPNVKTF